MKWEYEPEGFELGDGTRYLPDFWLPDMGMWAEVKPITFTTEELRKVQALAVATGRPVLQLVGLPEYKRYWAIESDGENQTRDVDYILDDRKGNRYFWCMPSDCDLGPEWLSSDAASAYEAARSARFEHGESPSVRG